VPDHLHARIASFCAEAANTPPESPVSPPLRPGKKQESDTLVDENGSRGNKKKDKGKEKEKRENKKEKRRREKIMYFRNCYSQIILYILLLDNKNRMYYDK
jgi:hypothetical protein